VNDLIIDTHTFCLESTVLKIPETQEFFQEPQFDNTLFLTIAFESKDNRKVIEKVSQHNKLLGCYLICNPNPQLKQIAQSEYDEPSVVEALVQQKGVVGMKSIPSFYQVPLNNPLYFPYYAIAQGAGIPFMLHCSSSGSDYSSAAMIEEVVKKFPRLKLILAHFGGLNPVYMRKAVELASRYENIYLNTTAIDPEIEQIQVSISDYSHAKVTKTLERNEILDAFLAGAEIIPNRILFGSDLGYYQPSNYSRWPVTELPVEKQMRIFYENPVNLFGKRLLGEKISA
jgi:predicted TIM-barrel fold metal-dependent hydrolase